MRIVLLCKASRTEGLGHLFRSLSLGQYLNDHRPQWKVKLVIISGLNLHHILDNHEMHIEQIENETAIDIQDSMDILFLDMLSMESSRFSRLKTQSKKTISISPIFNQLSHCDMLITRTKYYDKKLEEKMAIKAGLQYSIIRPDCHQINSDHYTHILGLPAFQIAISMGGTDQHNITYKILKNLTSFEGRALFWVILGEGYSHSYHDLVEIIKENSKHEIILARTNQSMWNIMSNSSIAILAGGITSYEAAYAGLPAINYFHDPERSFLTEELVEKSLCVNNSYSVEDTIAELNKSYLEKERLLSIHKNCKAEFPGNPITNILHLLDQYELTSQL